MADIAGLSMLTTAIKRLFKAGMPKSTAPNVTSSFPHRRDNCVISVQPGLDVHVFWKRMTKGSGPSCAVFANGYQLIKFDCYGGTAGHFHVAMPARSVTQQNILRLDGTTVEQHIDRAMFELANNLAFYLSRSDLPAVQGFDIDKDAMAAALPRIRLMMLERQVMSRKSKA